MGLLSYSATASRLRSSSTVIGISGLFTFAWTGSVLVYVMGQNGKLHLSNSRPGGKKKTVCRVNQRTQRPESNL